MNIEAVEMERFWDSQEECDQYDDYNFIYFIVLTFTRK